MEQEFFLAYDIEFVIRRFQSELQYLHQNWTALGRPTVTVLLTRNLLGADRTAFYAFMRQVASGTVAGVPVKRGTLSELMTTASFERIDDLHDMVLPKSPLREFARRGKALAQPELQVPLNGAARDALSLDSSAIALTLRLEQTGNLYEQIELLALLLRQLPLQAAVSFRGATRSLADVLQEVYEQAGRLRLWAVVRRAAGLLGKVDGDLSLAVGAILVRQMNIQIGRLYAEDAMITQPIPEHELLAKIKTYCPNDIRDQVLTQELLLYLSLLIKAQPELFAGLLTVRVSHLISLLVTQLSAELRVSQAEAYEQLMHQPPSLIQRRLEQVVASPVAASVPPRRTPRGARPKADVGWVQDLGFELIPVPKDGWLEWRQHNGTIDRRTTTFYSAVWNIAHHTPAIVVGRRSGMRGRMDSSIVASDTTPGEAAFALWLEQLLNQIDAAEYRQLTVEALAVVASFFLQNSSVRLVDELDVDLILERAARLGGRQPGATQAELNAGSEEIWANFYTKEPAYTAKAVADVLRSMVEPAR
jgi:phosphorylase kinase alpha/beta subunit